MCTALTYHTKDNYFGRNLDLEFSYNETVTVTPRNYPFHFRMLPTLEKHYAMIGMAYVVDDYPLYYDATNEKGLSIAGLNFPRNADYKPIDKSKDNVAPFELIPWVLGQCETVQQCKCLFQRINIANTHFSNELPLSPLHWMISDREESITVESVKEGLKIYDNPVGVLTNNPAFDMQLFNLNNYMSLSVEPPENHFSEQLQLETYSRGMGAMGMPGDWSSASRFVKATFVKSNAVSGESESESVSQFFHMLDSVAHPRGCVHMGNQQYEITIYSSCCNVDKGIYYYTTYENRQITAVDMKRIELNGKQLVNYPLIKEQQMHYY
ncbi:MAG: choloylglycine hydrolase [Lachnospiraceae bacterium]|nr:choloylglycine hydrolase [Lachnospiraceae bacterium]